METEKTVEHYRHRIPIQLRFNDVDAFGHVNNAVMFSLYDMAKTEYFRAVFGDRRREDLSVVVVNVNADFIHPVYYGDRIEIATAAVRLGNKSVTLSQEAVNLTSGSVVSRCRTVMVAFSASAKDSVPIPSDIRRRFIDYENNILL